LRNEVGAILVCLGSGSKPWFIDTNYDSERFIVPHAYFLGDDEVFDDLKRALKDEIDARGQAFTPTEADPSRSQRLERWR
jgi:hypothetical protein